MKWQEYVADRWVSWLLELTVLIVIAYFTISETRKTNEQTRQMIARWDSAISSYASEKTKVVDSAIASGIEKAKEKASSVKLEDVKELISTFRDNSDQSDETTPPNE